MSNAVYPDLPGVKITVTRTPIWKTSIKQSVSGREVRASHMAYPLWDYSLAYDVLRSSAAEAELQALVGFFNARRGAWDDFLFSVPDDDTATDYQFGTGNGSTAAFQLLKAFGGFIEPVYDLKGVPAIRKAGALLATPADYAISATGLVTFTTPPAAGAALTWSGGYYQRCRFKQDTTSFDRFMHQLWEAKRVELRSVKA